MGRIRLVHYHTDTLGAAPTAKDLKSGEIALNTNPITYRVFTKDSNGETHEQILPETFLANTLADEEHLNSYSTIENSQFDGGSCVLKVGRWRNGQVTPPSWCILYSPTIYFGADDVRGSISMNYGSPEIIFAGAYNNKRDNPWTMKITGSDGKTYNFENFISASSKKTEGTLSLAGTSFNGSSNVTIDKLDCGEF
mgnify:CR=1 FL=1